MLRLRVLFFFTLLAAPVIARAQTTAPSDRALWRFIDPGAKAVIGIDWARIRQTRPGAMMRDGMLKEKSTKQFPVLDLLDDVDHLLVSSPGKGLPGFEDADSPILVAIQGRFEAPMVRQIFTRMGAKTQAYNSFQVWRPQVQRGQDAGTKELAWVLVDANTFLFGDARSIFAALDRVQFPSSPPEGGLLARAAEMDAKYDLWVISDASEITANDQVAGLLQGGEEWIADLLSVEGGINLRGGLAADFLVRFGSEASAKRVMAELTRMMNLAAKDKSAGQMQTVAKRLKFDQDGAAFRASLKLSQQELEKSAQAFEAGRKAGTRLAGATVSVATPQRMPEPVPQVRPPMNADEQKPQTPAVIRIEGLDDGPREIPIGSSSH